MVYSLLCECPTTNAGGAEGFADRPKVGLGPARRVDWPIARAMALSGDRRAPVVAAKTLSRLGNGPIYFVILVALMVFRPKGSEAIVLSGGASIVLLHCVYPSIKRSAARPRPRDLGIACPGAPPPLDRYSFPSGHVMTLTAALFPIVLAAPASGRSVWRPGRRWRGRGWRSATISLPTSPPEP